jgi:hypothetical protein
MFDHENLSALGYTVGLRLDGNALVAPGTDVDGKPWTKTVSYGSDDRMKKMNGRLRNLAYMAKAIDERDGVAYEGPTRDDDEDGQEQFEHLMGLRGLHALGLTYVALRRLQRKGDLAALRVGLVILIALDQNEISASDALAAIEPKMLEEFAASTTTGRTVSALQAA